MLSAASFILYKHVSIKVAKCTRELRLASGHQSMEVRLADTVYKAAPPPELCNDKL